MTYKVPTWSACFLTFHLHLIPPCLPVVMVGESSVRPFWSSYRPSPHLPPGSHLEQRKIYCRAEQGEWSAHAQKPPNSPVVFREVFIGKFGVRAAGCVTFCWLVGEVTGHYSRNLILSWKLPSSTWVGALVPGSLPAAPPGRPLVLAEELKDILYMCVCACVYPLMRNQDPDHPVFFLVVDCFFFASVFPHFSDQ